MDYCNLNSIILEMIKYKVINNIHHSGDLYEHSVWTAKCLEKWIDERNFWVKDIKLSKKIIIISGLLHDFGKIGINPKYGNKKENYTYSFKPNHEEEGYKIMTGRKSIKIAEKINDFQKVINQQNLRKYLKTNCKITDLEYSIIAITGGLHYDFGKFISKMNDSRKTSKRNQILAYNYILLFMNLVKDKNLPYKFNCKNEFNLITNILRLCIAVSAADVMGAAPIMKDNSLYKSRVYYFLNLDKINKIIPLKKNIPYYKYNFNTKGIKFAEIIIKLFKTNKNIFF